MKTSRETQNKHTTGVVHVCTFHMIISPVVPVVHVSFDHTGRPGDVSRYPRTDACYDTTRYVCHFLAKIVSE